MNSKKSFFITGTFMRIDAPTTKEHQETFLNLLELFKTRDWTVGPDARIMENSPIIIEHYFEGVKGNLKFKGEKWPAFCSVEFYQDIVYTNPNGGQYDFNKLKKMPYLIKLRFLVELNHAKQFLLAQGYVDESKPVYKKADDCIRQHQSDSDYTAEKQPSYNVLDQNKKVIKEGDIKYFRDNKGRLQRGQVFYHINNMWWVKTGPFSYRNMACFEFFDYEPGIPRKLVKKSGHHNPLSRWNPNQKEAQIYIKAAKQLSKEGRLQKANAFLKQLYNYNWMSRCFQFIIKPSGRLGLVETEGAPYFLGQRLPLTKFPSPKPIPLYPSPRNMSSTESGWVKAMRNYIIYSDAKINTWFCNDHNGEGESSHYWPEVRKIMIKMGALHLPQKACS